MLRFARRLACALLWMLCVFFVSSSASWADTVPPDTSPSSPPSSPSPSPEVEPSPEVTDPGPTSEPEPSPEPEPPPTVVVEQPEPSSLGSTPSEPMYVEPSERLSTFLAAVSVLQCLALGVLVVRSF